MISSENPVVTAERKEEAKLLRQCAKLAEVSIQIAALLRLRTTIEAEERTNPELWSLQDRQAKIQRHIRSFRPTTDVGWTALARACMLGAWTTGGEVFCNNEDVEQIAWRVVAEVAGLPPLSIS